MNFTQLTSIPESSRWADILNKLAREPLQLCPDFPAIAARHEAWWEQSLVDHPLFLGAANTNPNRPITRRLELLEQPEQWLVAKQADLQQQHRVGDTLPAMRVDFGPVLLGGLFGGVREIGADTSWTHSFIHDDWSNAPDWTISDGQPVWKRLRHLARLAAETAKGCHLVCTPDLGNSADVLLNLRGATGLCTDVITRPKRVCQAVEAMIPSWLRIYTSLYDDILTPGAGLVHWLGLWSNQPYDVLACDFNALIGPQTFAELFLPPIAQQAAIVGRTVFHLDGPDAARHIDLLLDIPQLQAIQFTPGAGTPSALVWLEMFQKIQQKRKSLLVFCPAGEVMSLCKQLCLEGLALFIDEAMTPAGLDAVYEMFLTLY